MAHAGGRVFHNEKLADAASRIAQAELGITIELGELVGFVEFPFETDFVHSVSLAFFAKQTGGTLRNSEQSSEIKKWKELPPNMHKVQGEAYSRVWDRIEEQMR